MNLARKEPNPFVSREAGRAGRSCPTQTGISRPPPSLVTSQISSRGGGGDLGKKLTCQDADSPLCLASEPLPLSPAEALRIWQFLWLLKNYFFLF